MSNKGSETFIDITISNNNLICGRHWMGAGEWQWLILRQQNGDKIDSIFVSMFNNKAYKKRNDNGNVIHVSDVIMIYVYNLVGVIYLPSHLKMLKIFIMFYRTD